MEMRYGVVKRGDEAESSTASRFRIDGQGTGHHGTNRPALQPRMDQVAPSTVRNDNSTSIASASASLTRQSALTMYPSRYDHLCHHSQKQEPAQQANRFHQNTPGSQVARRASKHYGLRHAGPQGGYRKATIRPVGASVSEPKPMLWCAIKIRD